MKYLFCVLVVSFISVSSIAQTRYYVNGDLTTGNNDGSSWENAFKSLNSALNVVSTTLVDTVWVRKGVYKPTSSSNRSVFFRIQGDVVLYGGFNGTETKLNQVNPELNLTVLSGDIGVLNDNTDNSYHVIYSEVMSNQTMINGFTITGGHANGNGLDIYGGGVYNRTIGISASPKFYNCIIENNTAIYSGGGVFNYAGYNSNNASPEFINCVIQNNSGSGGAGVYNELTSYTSEAAIIGSPIFNNCVINNNINIGGSGGGVYNSIFSNSGVDSVVASPQFTNCQIENNSGSSGGGVFNELSSLSTTVGNVYSSFINCTIRNNQAEFNGGGVFNRSSAYIANSKPIFVNCLIEGNSADNNNGGGLYNDALTGGGQSNASIKCIKSIFKENTAYVRGGGVYNFARSNASGSTSITSPVMDACLFYKNIAGYGGAFLNYTSSTITNSRALSTLRVTNCIIIGNEATVDGGGVENQEASSLPTNSNNKIENCVFTLNKANKKGGGVHSFSNQTNGYFLVKNNIFRENLAENQADVFLENTNYDIAYNLFETEVTGEGNVYSIQNPFYDFNNPDGLDDEWLTDDDGLQLADNSLAIDAGDNTDVAKFDVLGNVRIVNNQVDMGAYEYKGLNSVINKVQDESVTFNLYPNPTNNQVAIEFNETTYSQIEILDLQGKLLKQFSVSSNQYSLDLMSFEKGVYLVRVKSEKGTEVQRLIKQ